MLKVIPGHVRTVVEIGGFSVIITAQFHIVKPRCG